MYSKQEMIPWARAQRSTTQSLKTLWIENTTKKGPIQSDQRVTFLSLSLHFCHLSFLTSCLSLSRRGLFRHFLSRLLFSSLLSQFCVSNADISLSLHCISLFIYNVFFTPFFLAILLTSSGSDSSLSLSLAVDLIDCRLFPVHENFQSLSLMAMLVVWSGKSCLSC